MTYLEMMNRFNDIVARYELRLCIEKPVNGYEFYLYFVDEDTHNLSKYISWFPEKDDPDELLKKLENLAFGFKRLGYSSGGVVS
jgi:hypothetical protein